MASIKQLNDNLFDQLSRLNSDIEGDDLKLEIERSKAMSQLGSVIVNNNKIALQAMKMVQNGAVNENDGIKLLGN